MVTTTKMDEIVIDTETTNKNPHKAILIGISYYKNNQSKYSYPKLAKWYDDHLFTIYHNGKYDVIVVNNSHIKLTDNKLPKINFDTYLAYKLLHIDRKAKLETIVKDLFDRDKEDLVQVYNKVTGKNRKTLPDEWWKDIPEEELAIYAQEDVKETYNIYQYCKKELDKRPELKKWFEEVEMPLCNILVKSELDGVKLNIPKLKQLDAEYTLKLKSLEQELTWIAGKEINLNSSKQLQEILYKLFKLPKLKKTKTGISTDTQTLKKLAERHSFPKKLLEYRELTKLHTAFVKPLIELADENDRVHPNYNQCGTVTRRMSCQEPNLQQIPSKSMQGQELRKCFIPRSGHKFLIADYSQVELRLLAHFSEEPKLIEAFKNGDDVHEQTAQFISKNMGNNFTRAQGKLLNFSIIYGKTAFGFAQDWNCSQEEAQVILDSYFKLYPRVREWIHEQQIRVQANNGWMKSLAGLPLYVKDISSNNKWKFEEAKRQSVNYLIQGSSQDILKKAIINVSNNLNHYPLLIVHDELVFEIPDVRLISNRSGFNNKSLYLTLLPSEINKMMKSAWKLKVPLEVSYSISDHWSK